MLKKVAIIWFCLSILVPPVFIQGGENGSGGVLFEHVNVIPMDREVVLTNYSVLVRNYKIEKLGPSASFKSPKNSIVIDGRGKYLIPSLADMHVHLEGDAWNLLCPPGSKFSGEEISLSDILYVYLANGITMANVMSALPEHIELREKVKKGEILAPRLILSKMIDGPGKAWPPPISTWVKDADEAETAVREFHRQGYDRVKAYSFLSRESYDAVIKTARSLNMPVDGHIPMSVSVNYILDSGQNMIAHVEEVMKHAKEFSPGEVKNLAGLIAKSNTWVTSTLSVSKNLISLFNDNIGEFAKPGTPYLHPMGYLVWTYIYENLYKPIPDNARKHIIKGYNSFQVPFIHEFHKRGGKLLAGTDALVPSTLPGFSLHEELELLVNAGLSNYETLKSSTTNPYIFLGEAGESGTIKEGNHANLLLLKKNPLQNISHTKSIAGVFYQNNWMTRKMLDQKMKKISVQFKKLLQAKLNGRNEKIQ